VTCWSAAELPPGLGERGAREAAKASARFFTSARAAISCPAISISMTRSSAPNIRFDSIAAGQSDFRSRTIRSTAFYGCHVFEHVRDTLALMAELHRVAKPDAR